MKTITLGVVANSAQKETTMASKDYDVKNNCTSPHRVSLGFAAPALDMRPSDPKPERKERLSKRTLRARKGKTVRVTSK